MGEQVGCVGFVVGVLVGDEVGVREGTAVFETSVVHGFTSTWNPQY